MTALERIKLIFPRELDQNNSALTCEIPIDSFNILESTIRPLMREAGLRAIYRGPRGKYDGQTMTHRKDATGVLLYYKN